MNSYKVTYLLNGEEHYDHITERTEKAAQKRLKGIYKDAEITDTELTSTDVNATKEQERETLEKIKAMYRVACTRKEASCILGNFFSGLSQVCESCQRRPRDELALIIRDGLKLTGEASLTIEGRSSITGEPATVKLTDYGFEFYGDIAEIERIRKGRCVGYGGTVYPAEEG